MTPLKAIRAYCLGCSNQQASEVSLCPMTKCELFEFRFGHGAKQSLSIEQRQARSDRMRSLWKSAEKNVANSETDVLDEQSTVAGLENEKEPVFIGQK